MGGGEKTLYPMLGVGAFFVMFWIGFVVGYELGLGCGLFLLNALLFACTGTWCVVKLESANACPRPPPETGRETPRRADKPALPAFPHPFASSTR